MKILPDGTVNEGNIFSNTGNQILWCFHVDRMDKYRLLFENIIFGSPSGYRDLDYWSQVYDIYYIYNRNVKIQEKDKFSFSTCFWWNSSSYVLNLGIYTCKDRGGIFGGGCKNSRMYIHYDGHRQTIYFYI